jgi:tetratricopeptide (TPR) repeat protein
VGYFEQPLGTLQHLPEQRDTCEQAIDLRLALRTALSPLGDRGHVLAYLREAEALAVALDDPRRLGQVLCFLANHFRLMGAPDQAIAAAPRALALATASGEVGLQALATAYLGRAYESQGDYRRSTAYYGQAAAFFDGARHRERFGQIIVPAVSYRAWLALCHAALGLFAEGITLGQEGLRMAEASNHPISLMFACWKIGLLALRQGDLPRALPLLKRAMSICRDADFPSFFSQVCAGLGAAYTLGGRIADAVLLLTQALEQSVTMESVDIQALCSLSLGEAQMLSGHLEEAQALAEQALTFAREHQERGKEAHTLRLLGDIHAQHQTPDIEQAEAHLPPSPRPSRGTRHAPAPGPLPPRPRHAVRQGRTAGTGPHRAVYGYRALS